MKPLSCILFLVAALVCANPADTVSITADDLRKQPGPKPPAVQLVKIREGVKWSSLKLDEYWLERFSIQGDILTIRVTYGGGCKDDDVGLVAFKTTFTADRAEVDLIVTHNSYNDPCEAIEGDNYRFDLTDIKTAFANSAAAAQSSISLRIFDPKTKKPAKTLSYSVK